MPPPAIHAMVVGSHSDRVDVAGFPRDALYYNGNELGDVRLVLENARLFPERFRDWGLALSARVRADYKLRQVLRPRIVVWDAEHVTTNPCDPAYTARHTWPTPTEYDVALGRVLAFAAERLKLAHPAAEFVGVTHLPPLAAYTAHIKDPVNSANLDRFRAWCSLNGWLGAIGNAMFPYLYPTLEQSGDEFASVLAELRRAFPGRPIVPILRVRREASESIVTSEPVLARLLHAMASHDVAHAAVWEAARPPDQASHSDEARLVSQGFANLRRALAAMPR